MNTQQLYKFSITPQASPVTYYVVAAGMVEAAREAQRRANCESNHACVDHLVLLSTHVTALKVES
jgi:hypothetical protein